MKSAAAFGLLLLLSGCTHWRHAPPVPLDQHKVDLRACIGVANGRSPLVVVPVVGTAPLTQALGGFAMAATIAEEFAFEQRLRSCMSQRGYRRAGFTTNIYGWKGE